MITIISFIYAIYVNNKHKKLLNYNREQSWEVYRQATKILMIFQELEKMSIADKSAIVKIAKGESCSQELAFNSIKIIKRYTEKFDLSILEKWNKEGKFNNESHFNAFKVFLDD